MKKKNTSEELATKTDLLIFKQELKEEIVSEIDEKNKQYKDEVLTKLDDISGQLEGLREDKLLSIHQSSNFRAS